MLEPAQSPENHTPHRRAGRLSVVFGLALTVALSAYILIDGTKAYRVALASVWFLAILPAFLCALIAYFGDPDNDRDSDFYWSIPPTLVAIVVVGSIYFLHEGVICLIMLSPIWLASGWIGVFVLRSQHLRKVNRNALHCSILFLPLLAGAVESQIPYPYERVTLVRSVTIRATPDEIWPFTLSNPHIAKTEGRSNFSQNIVGIPRPSATRLAGAGPGAIRTAYWGDNINFDEIITDWQPNRRLAWNFSFTNSSLQNYTDQHISPDGQFLKIESGDYTIRPLAANLTLLTLRTNYIAKTHVNTYAKLWAEILLGDVQNNILGILQQRAEATHQMTAASLAAAPRTP